MSPQEPSAQAYLSTCGLRSIATWYLRTIGERKKEEQHHRSHLLVKDLFAADMSAKSIFEADGKAILNYHLTRAPVIKPSPLPTPTKHNPPPRLASLNFPEDKSVEDVLNQAEVTYPWLLQDGAKFVAKPDQLIKRRGKSGLLALNKTWPEAKAWVAERAGKAQKVEHVEGVLRQFLVEPFVPHPDGTEYYININSVRDVSPKIPSPALSMMVAFPMLVRGRKRPWLLDRKQVQVCSKVRRTAAV